MPHLINPFGRIVSVSDADYDLWLSTPGFSKATKEQAEAFVKERIEKVDRQNQPEEIDNEHGIYFATVSQGGKDGYSMASGCLVKELKEKGYQVKTFNTGQNLAILFHNPYSVLQLENPHRIIYTMFESDKIPDDWHDYLEAADLVIVPSKWCQGVFKKAGIETKVVPLGYDGTVFTFKKRENKLKQRKDFVFLHYNAFNIRKGFPEVLKAFVKAFEKTEPVKMIFKTTLESPPLPIRKEQYPNIEVITGKVSQKEMLDICYRSDCFVFPSRGEGFGIPPLEAMATGMSAIVPNAHGITEYFNPEFMYEVKVKDTCPALYSRYKGQDVGKMVVCDVDQLASQMRWIYEHQDENIQMGVKAAEYVKQWTLARSVEKLKPLIDDIMVKPYKERQFQNALPLELVQ